MGEGSYDNFLALSGISISFVFCCSLKILWSCWLFSYNFFGSESIELVYCTPVFPTVLSSLLGVILYIQICVFSASVLLCFHLHHLRLVKQYKANLSMAHLNRIALTPVHRNPCVKTFLSHNKREWHRQTDRQTDRRTDGQTDRQTEREAGNFTEWSANNYCTGKRKIQHSWWRSEWGTTVRVLEGDGKECGVEEWISPTLSTIAHFSCHTRLNLIISELFLLTPHTSKILLVEWHFVQWEWQVISTFTETEGCWNVFTQQTCLF